MCRKQREEKKKKNTALMLFLSLLLIGPPYTSVFAVSIIVHFLLRGTYNVYAERSSTSFEHVRKFNH